MLSKNNYAIKKSYESINGEPWEKVWYVTCKRAKHFKLPKIPFKNKMEECFTEGMCWENHGEWEVDHIIPLCKGGKHSPKNLQPLWATDNHKKGSN